MITTQTKNVTLSLIKYFFHTHDTVMFLAKVQAVLPLLLIFLIAKVWAVLPLPASVM